MRKPFVINILLGSAMALACFLAVLMTPTRKLADQQAKFALEELIPKKFEDWQIDKTIVPIQVAPEVIAKLNKIYNQTLSRTYTNSKGEKIMLSIAYGGEQSGESTQVHRPEFCYTAQGFNIVSNREAKLMTASGTIPIRRLKAVQGARIEPITYWLTVGDKATLPGIGRMWTQISYGLTGVVADGMLVRLSSIEKNEDLAYQIQGQFINNLLSNLDERAKTRLTGKLDN
jgi:EpsI family protein